MPNWETQEKPRFCFIFILAAVHACVNLRILNPEGPPRRDQRGERAPQEGSEGGRRCGDHEQTLKKKNIINKKLKAL
jgi:hypothetical protein